MKIRFSGLAITLAVAGVVVAARIASAAPQYQNDGDEPAEEQVDAPVLPKPPPIKPPPQTAKKCYAEDVTGACPSECREFELRSRGTLLQRACAARAFCDQSIFPCGE